MNNKNMQSSSEYTRRNLHRMKLHTATGVPEKQPTILMPTVNGQNDIGVRGGMGVSTSPQFLLEPETRPNLPSLSEADRIAIRERQWKPGTFGFGDDSRHPGFLQRDTLQMMVLDGISKHQGQQSPVMQSEISGAAGAAGLVGFGNLVGSFLKYGVTYLIQYSLGPALYGIYTLCLSLINLVAAVLNLGLDDAMVRFVAIYRSAKQPSALRGLTIFCTAVAGVVGIIGALLLLLFAPSLVSVWVAFKIHDAANKSLPLVHMIPLLQMLVPMIPLLCMQVIWFGGLRGFKAFKWRVLSTNILQPILQILLLVGVLFFFRNIIGIALVLLVSTLFSTVLNLYFLSRLISRLSSSEPEAYKVREWFSFASFNFLTTIIDTILDSIDTVLLAVFGVAAVQLGQYGAATRLSYFITMPLLSLNAMFAPTIAELHSKGENQKLETMFKVVTKWSITFSLPILLIMTLFSKSLLGLAGSGYVSAWPLVIAFSLGFMINAGTGSVGYMLLMTGYQRLSFLNSLVAIVVNIVLGIMLTPRYGAMGTAISTGSAICIVNIMRLIQVRLLLKMQPYRRDTLKPIVAGVISATFIGGLLYLMNSAHLDLTFELRHAIVSLNLILVPVLLAGYVGILVMLKGSPEDEIVVNALRKRLKRGMNRNQKKV